MKPYFILDCPKQQKIADSLHGYYTGITVNRTITNFWNSLNREEIKNYFSIPNISKYFKYILHTAKNSSLNCSSLQ